MTRVREVYYFDHGPDFGLGGYAAALVARTGLRLDEGVTLAIARARAEADDVQLGRDVRLLLDSGLPDDVLHAVWTAAVRRRFDPVEETGAGVRGWLRRVSAVCPPCVLARSPYEVTSLDEVRPAVPEEELRAAVAVEIESAAAGLARAVAVPDVVPALLRVVREADADLGLRLFLQVAKAYSVTFGEEAYDRLVALGDRLAYPWEVVGKGLDVRRPPVDPGRRDLGTGRFGVPFLAAVFRGTDWPHLGSVRENVLRVIGDDYGDVPGSYAAVLLEDARRLLDSPLPDSPLTALWRAVSRRAWVTGEGEFDADVRDWLERVAGMCGERLVEVDPCYVPYVSPARTDLTEAVLREVRELTRSDVAEVRAVAPLLADVVTAVDPDLGFRLLVQLLSTYEVAATGARYTRWVALAERLGLSPDFVDDHQPRPVH
ncbi:MULTISPECIES: hypothetical protein [Streptomyces]|uniref:CdiI immunity protein domain-containing protein n=1 Tax=Streptomyces venezuelae TaxID=54571 RepID=A0A5P2B011_STRVZ|nr:hypothetical protein [Streptomyces venezuelae]QES22491.1 hypothetical protein DEJ46_28125 [Streptomyces venezuelae]